MTTEEKMQSQTIGKIAAALAKAQSAMKNAAKNATNPHFKRTFADLSSVREAMLSALNANEIAVIQPTETPDMDTVIVHTRLIHSSGEWLSSSIRLQLDRQGRNSAQAAGSVISYGRRYMLAALCCVAADEDDDAASAPTTKAPSSSPQPVDDGVQKARKAIADAKTVAEMDAVGAKLNKSSKDVRDAVMGDFAEKLAALKGQAA